MIKSFPKESVGEKMFVKFNDTGRWICLESVREISLFYIVTETITKVPNKIVNAYIQEAAKKFGYDEIDLVLDGIDAASAKELAQDLINKVFNPESR